MDELIKQIRYCAKDVDCSTCKYQYEGLVGTVECRMDMMLDAADAIERLGKTIEQQYETIAQLEADLEAAYNH